MEHATIKNISAHEAKELIEKKTEITIIDVRTPIEFKMGTIENSINLDAYSPSIMNKLNELNKNNKYLIYCRTGARSSMIINAMKQMGFIKIYHIQNGILEWERNGFKTVKN